MPAAAIQLATVIGPKAAGVVVVETIAWMAGHFGLSFDVTLAAILDGGAAAEKFTQLIGVAAAGFAEA